MDNFTMAHQNSEKKSSIDFDDVFSRVLPNISTKKNPSFLKAAWIETLLGNMLAIADDQKLYLLEFIDRVGLEREIEYLRIKTHSIIVPKEFSLTARLRKELTLYFAGKIQQFTLPIQYVGPPFQQRVWAALKKIPYGQTCSYAEMARNIANPAACRAVARANAANQFAIIIPCHRVINSNGKLGGYAGGIARKQWLIAHEQKYANN